MKNPFPEMEAIQSRTIGTIWGLMPADADLWQGFLWDEDKARYAAHAINQHEKLVAAVKTYQDLCTCYRIGKRPTEKLFKMLDDAKAALLKEETP